jgi:hypothetical protein
MFFFIIGRWLKAKHFIEQTLVIIMKTKDSGVTAIVLLYNRLIYSEKDATLAHGTQSLWRQTNYGT